MRLQKLLFATLICSSSVTFAQHDARQIKEDITRHRALAKMQTLSAQCFADNKGKEACMQEMKTICTGLAIGKFCGLKEEATEDPVKSFAATSKAHLAAAQCMESGKPYEDCVWDLQTACKGLGIGKDCGMLHVHSF